MQLERSVLEAVRLVLAMVVVTERKAQEAIQVLVGRFLVFPLVVLGQPGLVVLAAAAGTTMTVLILLLAQAAAPAYLVQVQTVQQEAEAPPALAMLAAEAAEAEEPQGVGLHQVQQEAEAPMADIKVQPQRGLLAHTANLACGSSGPATFGHFHQHEQQTNRKTPCNTHKSPNPAKPFKSQQAVMLSGTPLTFALRLH